MSVERVKNVTLTIEGGCNIGEMEIKKNYTL